MHTFPLYIQLHNIIMRNHDYEHVYVPGVNVFFLSIRSLGYGDVCRILINGSFGAISILVETKEVCRMALYIITTGLHKTFPSCSSPKEITAIIQLTWTGSQVYEVRDALLFCQASLEIVYIDKTLTQTGGKMSAALESYM